MPGSKPSNPKISGTFSFGAHIDNAQGRREEKDVMNVEKPTEMVLPNATRWTGNSRTLTRTNEKEPALRKLHTKPEDDGTEKTTAGDADEDDSDSGSSSESESDEVAPVRSAKNVRKYRERVEPRSLTSAEWTSGKDRK